MADVDQHEATRPPPRTVAELSYDEFLAVIKNVMAQILRENPRLTRATVDAVRSEAVSEAVDELMEKTGDNREDLLLKALVLYEAAIEASRKGQRLALLGHDYRLVREITGFESPTVAALHPDTVAG